MLGTESGGVGGARKVAPPSAADASRAAAASSVLRAEWSRVHSEAERGVWAAREWLFPPARGRLPRP